MISGRFEERGKLIFEIELVTAYGEKLAVDVLVDTGFTTGYLAVNADDIEALGWSILTSEVFISSIGAIANPPS